MGWNLSNNSLIARRRPVLPDGSGPGHVLQVIPLALPKFRHARVSGEPVGRRMTTRRPRRPLPQGPSGPRLASAPSSYSQRICHLGRAKKLGSWFRFSANEATASRGRLVRDTRSFPCVLTPKTAARTCITVMAVEFLLKSRKESCAVPFGNIHEVAIAMRRRSLKRTAPHHLPRSRRPARATETKAARSVSKFKAIGRHLWPERAIDLLAGLFLGQSMPL